MTGVDVELGDGESLVADLSEFIFRQIAEWMMQGGPIQTTVFGPSPSDNGRPSYSRSSVVTAQKSRDWHNENARSRSVGVWALSVDEVHSAERFVIDDSGAPDGEERPPGHCYVDFRGLAKIDIKSIRYRLYVYAMKRGEIPTVETAPIGQLFS